MRTRRQREAKEPALVKPDSNPGSSRTRGEDWGPHDSSSLGVPRTSALLGTIRSGKLRLCLLTPLGRISYRGVLTFCLGPCWLPSRTPAAASGAGEKKSELLQPEQRCLQIHARGFRPARVTPDAADHGSDAAPPCTQRAAQLARAPLQLTGSERSPLVAFSGKAATPGQEESCCL